MAAVAGIAIALFALIAWFGSLGGQSEIASVAQDGAPLHVTMDTSAIDDVLKEAVRRGKVGHLTKPIPVVYSSVHGETEIFVMSWSAKDLAGIDWNDPDTHRLLDDAEFKVSWGNGLVAAENYCDSPSGVGQFSTHFCNVTAVHAGKAFLAKHGG